MLRYVVYMRIAIVTLLLLAFGCLFYYLRKSGIVSRKLHQAYEMIDMSSLERERATKKAIGNIPNGYLSRWDKKLNYSGLKKWFPFLTIEIWIIAMLLSSATVYFLIVLLTDGWILGLISAGLTILFYLAIEHFLSNKNYQVTDASLMDFLNLLSNYSITAGEITSVFGQISRYLKYPINDALDACYYESQVTGDTNAALITLSEAVEHPKFQEIIRNLEVCSRYTTDFEALIKNSKKELKIYYSGKQDRKSMANEALINLLIIVIMLIVALVMVDSLIEMSIWHIVFHTLVGKICIGFAGGLVALFLWEISLISR